MSDRILDTKYAFEMSGLPEAISEWWADLDPAFKQPSGSLEDEWREWIGEHLHEAADCKLIYTSDIAQAWVELGCPDDYPMLRDGDSLADAIGIEVHYALTERWEREAREYLDDLEGFFEVYESQEGTW